MGHAMINGVYDWQDGPRGDEKFFLAGMGSARRELGNGTLNLRAMLSPDPFMGRRGYPLLLAAGETANGVTSLGDRQHPHDLFMELSASYSLKISETGSFFIYGGLPGEPAFGPLAFMHRPASMDNPAAAISHHWLDSTHITFGVLTAGLVQDNWKIEVSRFKGREPDEHRFDIEDPKLDSTSVRVSVNPNENWSLQISWADIESPEQLEPDDDETRFSARAIYVTPVERGQFSATLAAAVKDHGGEELTALAAEAALTRDEVWTFFGRGEIVETDELTPGGGHGPIETVGQLTLGAIRDFQISDSTKIGFGGLVSANFVPDSLESSYNGDPMGAMVFIRLAIGG